MTRTFDLVIRGGRVVTPSGPVRTAVAVADGRIAEIGDIAARQAGEVLDATGLTVLPGVIDTQVHFREPGNEAREDLAHGSRAAVAGGVAAVFEMPNTSPATVTAEGPVRQAAKGPRGMWCDHAFFVGAGGGGDDALAELEMLPGCYGRSAIAPTMTN